ncbi:uncharacterized protein N7477_007844 [Penicillium maclennaniae]|uniref:uncharacterized protein n=1 Tax=Penicillium maclennaniae TaxID=1343394 RepID=UPI00253FFF01|nr:uncharacterized protein N7477_007844 [Penicillium maclennaniae]KAJ5665396.1 hypothetical protein N7477_007844 [Penicillium maclennaniae]
MGDIASVHSHLFQEGLPHWLQKNRFNKTDFSIPKLATIVDEKHLKVTVLIPAKEVAATIAEVIKKAVRPLIDAGVVHEVFVIDAASHWRVNLQPGEVSLKKLHFPVGYGVEIGTLIDAYRLVGLSALAEVDVGQRQNFHRPLRDLTTMAGTILATAEMRLGKGEIWHGKDVYTMDYRSSQGSHPCPPIVVVEGVRMFRDIGGSPVSGLRKGLVFRSGDPSTMTQLGLAKVLELGIEKIFDQRSPIEFEGHHSVHGASHQSMLAQETSPIYPLTDIVMLGSLEWSSLYSQMKNGTKTGETPVFASYAEAYMHVLRSGAISFLPIFHHLAQPKPSPILVHCTAGKDRTGVTSMLIMLLAGFSHDSIADAYALNNLDSKRTWGVQATRRLLAQPGLRGNIDAVENIVRAQNSYMLATLRRFQQEIGTIDAYIKSFLKWTIARMVVSRQTC